MRGDVGARAGRSTPGCDPVTTPSTVATRALLAYTWPRNVRELRRCLERAVSMARTRIEPAHLPSSAHDEPPTDAPLAPEGVARRDELIHLLVEHGGNISARARAGGT